MMGVLICSHDSFALIPAGFNFLLPEAILFRIMFSEGLWVSNFLIYSYLFHPHLWIEVEKDKKEKISWHLGLI